MKPKTMADKKETIETDLELFRDLINKTNDAIFVNDPRTGRFIFVNDKACTSLGYARPELLEMNVMDIETTFPDNFSWQTHVDNLRHRGSQILEGIHKRKDGATFPVEINVSYVVLNTTDYMVAVVRDITERKQAAEALRTHEKQLAESQRIAHVGSWEHNLTTGQVFWSDELFRLIGLDPKADPADVEIFFEMLHPDDKPLLKKAIDETVRFHTPFNIEYRVILKNGSTRILQAQAELIHDNTGTEAILSGTVQDVTERKRAEEKLQKEKDFSTSIINGTPAIICGIAPDGTTTFINPAGQTITGYNTEELIGKSWWTTFYPGDEYRQVEQLFRDFKKGNIRDYEMKLTTRDGNKRTISWNSLNMFDRDGNVVQIIGFGNDITEYKQAEEKLRESEILLRESQIIAGLGSYIIDIPTGLCKTSDVVDKLFGIDETYSRSFDTWLALVHPDDRKMMRDYYRNEVLGQGGTFDKEYRIIRYNDKAERWVHGLGKLEFDVKGRPLKMRGTVQDVTDRKKMEEQLHQSQKLEAIGALAGGIAHDFNNLLQGVFGYISMAKIAQDDKERSLAMLEQAEKALHMSVNLTTQLLTFSRGGKPVKKKIPLQSVIENSVRFALSGSMADYRIKIDTDLWHAEADEGQIGQVIQNIVLNADQAMPLGGTIMIVAKNVRVPKEGMARLPKEGKYVEITVQDNGIGISDEYLSKIFDPYFTTKAKGSGLGLATCYSIIKNHGGVIHVSSKVGKGTTFYVYLPAVEAEKETLQLLESSPFVRGGKILIMDDEEMIRNIAEEMIKTLGHEIELAEHGEEAIEKYKAAMESGNPFDIVILDLTIRGGMGGRETIDRLLAVNPKIMAIVSSGYSDDAVVSDYHKYGFSARLTKPYKLEELRNMLNKLLS